VDKVMWWVFVDGVSIYKSEIESLARVEYIAAIEKEKNRVKTTRVVVDSIESQ